jgi:hypothetical protein
MALDDYSEAKMNDFPTRIRRLAARRGPNAIALTQQP